MYEGLSKIVILVNIMGIARNCSDLCDVIYEQSLSVYVGEGGGGTVI